MVRVIEGIVGTKKNGNGLQVILRVLKKEFYAKLENVNTTL
jgi:hypothetical protein